MTEAASSSKAYRVEPWYISGEKTGYRVMKGHEPVQGFAADWKREGAFEQAQRRAQTLCDTLNLAEPV